MWTFTKLNLECIFVHINFWNCSYILYYVTKEMLVLLEGDGHAGERWDLLKAPSHAWTASFCFCLRGSLEAACPPSDLWRQGRSHTLIHHTEGPGAQSFIGPKIFTLQQRAREACSLRPGFVSEGLQTSERTSCSICLGELGPSLASLTTTAIVTMVIVF